MKEVKTPKEIQAELNSWLETVNDFGSVRQFYALEESYKDANRLINGRLGKKLMYPEDYDTAGIGTKSDCDTFFTEFNNKAEYLEDILVLKKYLTDGELKERLLPEVYINLETDKVADKYILNLERKALERHLNAKLAEIEELKKKIDPENYLSDRLICKQINDKFITIADKFTEAEYKFIINKRFDSDTEFYAVIENLKNTRKP